MELTVLERAALLNALPKEGNFKTLKTVRKLRESLSLTDEETEKWKPNISEEGQFTWLLKDENGNLIPQETEIDIGEIAREVISDALKKLDRERKLNNDLFSLYEKFIQD